jgi:hypothetical protein
MNAFEKLAVSLTTAATVFSTTALAADTTPAGEKSKIMQYQGLCVRTNIHATSIKPEYFVRIQVPGQSKVLEADETTIRAKAAFHANYNTYTLPKDSTFAVFIKEQGAEFSRAVKDIDIDKRKAAPSVPFCGPTV